MLSEQPWKQVTWDEVHSKEGKVQELDTVGI